MKLEKGLRDAASPRPRVLDILSMTRRMAEGAFQRPGDGGGRQRVLPLRIVPVRTPLAALEDE